MKKINAKKIFFVIAIILLNGMRYQIDNVYGQEDSNFSKIEIKNSDHKVTKDDIIMDEVNWTFTEAYSMEEIVNYKNALLEQGKVGIVLLTNFNNGFVEANDFIWNPIILEQIKITNEETIDTYSQMIQDVKDQGYQPNYDKISLEIGEVEAVGDVVSIQIPWLNENSNVKYSQSINVSFASEVVGFFMTKDEI